MTCLVAIEKLGLFWTDSIAERFQESLTLTSDPEYYWKISEPFLFHFLYLYITSFRLRRY